MKLEPKKKHLVHYPVGRTVSEIQKIFYDVIKAPSDGTIAIPTSKIEDYAKDFIVSVVCDFGENWKVVKLKKK